MRRGRELITVSTRSIRPVIERLRSLRMDIDALLGAVGTDSATVDDPDGRIPHHIALAVWHEAAVHSGDKAFGIHAAESIHAGAFDVLDYATRSSATLGEGFQRLVRYQRLLHDAAVVQLRVDGERAHITHALPPPAADLPRHPAEFIVAAWLVVARQATGSDFAPLEASFRHVAPADVTDHRRIFRSPLRFDAALNGLVLPRALLDLRLVKSDPGLCAVLERHLRERLERLRPEKSFGARVREVVAKDLSTSQPSAVSTARKLHMSSRTLQRTLRDEGTTFTELVDGLRRELAAEYLREPQIAIAEVAFLLGFSEVSAFHRAFKRWYGVTPAHYRRQPLTQLAG